MGISLFYKHQDPIYDGNYELSGYYWWYKFLGLSWYNEIGPTHFLYEDFGDVNVPFEDWWWAHTELFEPVRHSPMLQLETVDDFSASIKRGEIVISFRKGASQNQILGEMPMWLLELGIRKEAPGRRKHRDEQLDAKYEFHQRPNVNALKIMYSCYVHKRDNPAATAYQIAEAVGILGGNKIQLKDTRLKKKDTKYEMADKKNRVGAIVSRYLQKADDVIKGVEAGAFPLYRSAEQKRASKEAKRLRELKRSRSLSTD